jgi:hypothetical protein
MTLDGLSRAVLARPMVLLASEKDQREFHLTVAEYKRLMTVPGFAPATLAQTMGPNWRDVFWLAPNGRKSRSRPAVVCNPSLRLCDVFALIVGVGGK